MRELQYEFLTNLCRKSWNNAFRTREISAAFFALSLVVVSNSAADGDHRVELWYEHYLQPEAPIGHVTTWPDTVHSDPVPVPSVWSFDSTAPVQWEIETSRQMIWSSEEPTVRESTANGQKYVLPTESHQYVALTEHNDTRSGLILERTVEPPVLAPGVNRIRVTTRLTVAEPPTVDGRPATITSGWLDVRTQSGCICSGEQITGDSFSPVDIVIASGASRIGKVSGFDIGDSHELVIHAEVENPNERNVEFLPEMVLQLDMEMDPQNSTPSEVVDDAAEVEFEVQAIAGESARLKFTMDDEAHDWNYSPANVPGVRLIWGSSQGLALGAFQEPTPSGGTTSDIQEVATPDFDSVDQSATTESKRGFFVNPGPGENVDLPLEDLADPTILSVIGILVTLFMATVQLARGK